MDTSKETSKAFQQDDVLSAADVASNVVIKPEEEYAYGFIIEVLTSGLYPDEGISQLRNPPMYELKHVWASE